MRFHRVPNFAEIFFVPINTHLLLMGNMGIKMKLKFSIFMQNFFQQKISAKVETL